ncbi:Fic family protein [bacterium]
MKLPYFPNVQNKFKKLDKKDKKLYVKLWFLNEQFGKDTDIGRFLKKAYEEYWTWEKFSNMPLPKLPTKKYSHELLWIYMRLFVRGKGKQLKNFNHLEGKPFTYSLTDSILKDIHYIDMHLSDGILFQHSENDDFEKAESKKRIISSLINEAITSSQIEGAATTRKEAEAMIRSGKRPKTHDEKMILNNYRAIKLITEELKSNELSPDLIKRIHSILVNGILDDPNDIGSFRGEPVHVYDADGTNLFTPCDAKEIEERIKAVCDFANDKKEFYHPVIKAIILHFMIGYIHPFVDGNGRIARGLFYWYLIREGYKLFEYVSISEIIKQSPGQYKRAYLNSELDGGDITYFIYYHLKVINNCIHKLEEYVIKKVKEHKQLENKIKRADFNYRQIDLLNHAIKHKDFTYTIKSHENSNSISWATARADLFDLVKKGLLIKKLRGKELVFFVSEEIEERLMKRD